MTTRDFIFERIVREERTTEIEEGLLLVYTGNGKGKTSAAVGSLIRAFGRGKKPAYIAFLKTEEAYGEETVLKKIGIPTHFFGRDIFVVKGEERGVDQELAENGMRKAEELVRQGDIDLLVLDEVLVAVYLGLIAEEELLALIKARPKKMTMILTGRYASEGVIREADCVTGFDAIRHHFYAGRGIKKGIDY